MRPKSLAILQEVRNPINSIADSTSSKMMTRLKWLPPNLKSLRKPKPIF